MNAADAHPEIKAACLVPPSRPRPSNSPLILVFASDCFRFLWLVEFSTGAQIGTRPSQGTLLQPNPESCELVGRNWRQDEAVGRRRPGEGDRIRANDEGQKNCRRENGSKRRSPANRSGNAGAHI